LPTRDDEFNSRILLRKGVRKADGGLALAGKGQPELCKAQIVTWHQPPVKKNKKRGTQKFCPD